jgi:hypothetical protein
LVEDKKKEINEYLETWQSDLKQGKLCVFMLDECHLLWGDLCGYVWGLEFRLRQNKEVHYCKLNALKNHKSQTSD